MYNRYKIETPIKKSYFIKRENTITHILRNLDKKLTFISAPAGYGKTTMAIDVCNSTDRNISWINLDNNDQNLPVFFTALCNSMQLVIEGFMDAIDTITPDEDYWGYIGLFYQGLQIVKHKHIIVFDGYECLQDNFEVNQFVNLLIQRLPKNIHIIICSRTQTTLDLATLVIQQDISIINRDQMLLTFEEAQKIANNLKLDDGVCSQAFNTSGGWIAAFMIFLQYPLQSSSFAEDFLNQYIYREFIATLNPDVYIALKVTLPLETFSENDIARFSNISQETLDKLITKHQILDKRKVNGQIFFSYNSYLAKSVKNYLETKLPDEWQQACWNAAQILNLTDTRMLRLSISSGDSQLIGELIKHNLQEWTESDFFLFNSQYIAQYVSDSTTNEYCQLVHGEALLKKQPIQAIKIFKYLIAKDIDDKMLVNAIKIGLIRAHFYNGDYEILSEWQYSLSELNAYNYAIAQNFIARAYMSLENYTEAQKLFSEIKEIAIQENNEYLKILAIRGLAAHADYTGHCRTAIELNIKSLAYWQKRVNILEIIRTTNNLASCYYSLGELELSLKVIQPAVEQLEEYQLEEIFPLIYCTLGDIHLSQSSLAEAKTCYENTPKTQSVLARIYSLTGLARVSLNKKDLPQAQTLAEEALLESRKSRIGFTQGLALLILGVISHFNNHKQKAWGYFKNALEIYRSFNFLREEARTLTVMQTYNRERFESESLASNLKPIIVDIGFTPHIHDLLPFHKNKSSEKKLLRLKTFGDIKIYLNGQILSHKHLNGKKPIELLLYLALSHSPKTKDKITQDIWGEESSGSNQISVALSRVRKALGDKKSILRKGALYYLNETYIIDEDGLQILGITPEKIAEDNVLFLSQLDLTNYLPGLYGDWALDWKQSIETHIILIAKQLCINEAHEVDLVRNIIDSAAQIEPEHAIFHKWLISYYIDNKQYRKAHHQANRYKNATLEFGIAEDISVTKKLLSI